MMDLLIKNGTIVTATESFVADLAVKDGKITAIGKDLDTDAKEIVDATGKLVLPGAIDAHTHMAMPFGGTVSADSYLAGTRAAACGGVTTIFDYPVQHAGETILGLVNSKRKVLEKEACVDYAMHCCITNLNDGEILDELEKAVAEGITSFKCFLVYKKEGMMVDDATLARLLLRAKEYRKRPERRKNKCLVSLFEPPGICGGRSRSESSSLGKTSGCTDLYRAYGG